MTSVSDTQADRATDERLGIDGSRYGIYDGVIVWVEPDGSLTNRFRGQGGREDRIDDFIEIMQLGRATAAKADRKHPTVWPVLCVEPEEDSHTTIAVIGETLDDAKKAADDYCGLTLTWEHRNSIFDFQDYLVAVHPDDGSEFHVFEHEVES